jgi:hypothetical protein
LTKVCKSIFSNNNTWTVVFIFNPVQYLAEPPRHNLRKKKKKYYVDYKLIDSSKVNFQPIFKALLYERKIRIIYYIDLDEEKLTFIQGAASDSGHEGSEL